MSYLISVHTKTDFDQTFTCVFIYNTGSINFKHDFGLRSAVRRLAWQHNVGSFGDVKVKVTSIFKSS